MATLREKVFNALNTAKENGYDMVEDDPGMIAADLIHCNSDFEGLRDDEQVELQDFIIEWQESFAT